MQTLTKILWQGPYREHIINHTQLDRVLEGSPQRRYNLVNRALKQGELIRVSRGIYTLNPELNGVQFHPFTIAQVLAPGSYISFETALAYYGWIPEAVFETASVQPGRKSKTVDNEQLGRFSFYPLATQQGYFLELVERVPFGKRVALVAKPARALMDLVCHRKIEWQGLGWLEDGMRIEAETLNTITGAELRVLKRVYKQKRVQVFIAELERELELLQ